MKNTKKDIYDIMGDMIFLGTNNNIDFIYSKKRQKIITLSPNDHNITNLISYNFSGPTHKQLELISSFISFLDLEDLNINNYKKHFLDIIEEEENQIKKTLKTKDKKDFNYLQMNVKPCVATIRKILQELCFSAGFFDLSKEYGAGFFEIGGKFFLNSNKLFEVKNGDLIETDDRIFKNNNSTIVFSNTEDLNITDKTKEISKDEINDIFEVLDSFNFSQKTDRDLLIGWIAHAFFTGALGWRTHLNITGPRGTGKSTLLSFIKNLLGNFAILIDGSSTEAGIRQELKNDCKAVLIDESEADSGKITKNLEMLRSASSGATQLKGTSDQKGTSYELKTAGLVAGIVPPSFNAADASRFLMITLNELINEKVKDTPDLLLDSEKINDYSYKFVKFLLKRFNEMKIVKKEIQKIFFKQRFDSRFCETNGTVLAFAYLIKNHLNPISIEDFINSFDFSKQKELNEIKDQDEIFNKIYNMNISTSGYNSRLSNIVEYCYYNYNNSETAELKRVLNEIGCKMNVKGGAKELFIDVNFPAFREALKPLKLDKANIFEVLTRCDFIKKGSEIFTQDRIQFGSNSTGQKHKVKDIIVIDLVNVYGDDKIKEIEDNDFIEIPKENTNINYNEIQDFTF